MERARLRGRHGPRLRALDGWQDGAGNLGRVSLREHPIRRRVAGNAALAVGPRTNLWYQECSDHVAKNGDMLAVDTDMIGPYAYCADLSRSWTIDHTAMNDGQRRLYSAALDQIGHNVELIEIGMEYREY